ncbi:AraC family transcriptional regulator [Ferrovibrio terrae]|uniref:AraC family transcriptional regulator n=1 Tax=Ferrovibrio terrae TaxID=2594003 RepID=A0A516GZ24_9PROT|nr:AraC family transcriptional regulator [Ferrovibrio terrae]QDO96600.1 AraC family transcriptional regulator [Ferrovibrio terrae]
MAQTQTNDWFDFARDAQSGTEAVRARFHAHAYDPHFHDQVLIGVTEQGVQQFRCRREIHRSTPGRMIFMEPGETHDGEACAADGFTYAMLYFDPAWLQQSASLYAGRQTGEAVFHFPRTLDDDAALAQAVRMARRQISAPDNRMACDAALDHVVALLAQRFAGAPADKPGRAPRVAKLAREAMDAGFDGDLGLEELALAAGTDRFRLTRAFSAAYGLSPHAYLVQRRLNRARFLLSRGETPAAVAAATGFADQSHLGRWFRRAFGMTPAAYRRICTNLPDPQAA